MEYEVEIPGIVLRWLRILLVSVLVLSFVLVGRAVSPVGENGSPQLLTPRLARITAYQRDAREWAGRLQDIQAGLEGMLSNPSGNLLDQDSQANLLYGQLLNLQAEVDSAPVPPTLESLHAEFGEAVGATLDVAVLVAAWISAPTPENFSSAEEALNTAEEMLILINQNPWVEGLR